MLYSGVFLYFRATAGPPNVAGPRVAYPLYPTLSTGLAAAAAAAATASPPAVGLIHRP